MQMFVVIYRALPMLTAVPPCPMLPPGPPGEPPPCLRRLTVGIGWARPRPVSRRDETVLARRGFDAGHEGVDEFSERGVVGEVVVLGSLHQLPSTARDRLHHELDDRVVGGERHGAGGVTDGRGPPARLAFQTLRA